MGRLDSWLTLSRRQAHASIGRMPAYQARVESIGRDPAGRDTARLRCPTARLPLPGQALLAHHPESQAALAQTLFPIAIGPQTFTCLQPTGERWLPGDQVALRGPLGAGFQPPFGAQRWLLMAQDHELGPLLPLLAMGLEAGAAVSMAGADSVAGLPAEVEILAEAEAGLPWADYIAVTTSRLHLEAIVARLERMEPLPAQRVDLLLLDQLPCGFGACGACAVRTHHCWAWLCQQGSVLELSMIHG